MWNGPSQRTKALAIQKKRERDRLMKPFHVKRVEGKLVFSENADQKESALPVRILLNDLTSKGVGIFSTGPMVVGQKITLSFEEPKPFKTQGRIVWCQEHLKESHILSGTRFSFRIGVEFIFDSNEGKTKVEEYCKELFRTYQLGRLAA